MRRLVVLMIACVIVVPIVGFGPHGNAVRSMHSSGQRYSAVVPLESLPMVDSDAISIIKRRSPGRSGRDIITHGLRMSPEPAGYTHAEFHVGRQYSELFGTVYGDNRSGGDAVTFGISDTSDPQSKKLLFRAPLRSGQRATFRISIRGIDYLTLGIETCCSAVFDVVADLIPIPRGPTQVTPSFPKQGAAVQPNSTVLITWRPFPGAVNYAVHIWIVARSEPVDILGNAPLTFSASVYYKTSYAWDDRDFVPGTYRYALLPLDARGTALVDWSAPVQFTIVEPPSCISIQIPHSRVKRC